jgi:hypothetical protein
MKKIELKVVSKGGQEYYDVMVGPSRNNKAQLQYGGYQWFQCDQKAKVFMAIDGGEWEEINIDHAGE